MTNKDTAAKAITRLEHLAHTLTHTGSDEVTTATLEVWGNTIAECVDELRPIVSDEPKKQTVTFRVTEQPKQEPQKIKLVPEQAKQSRSRDGMVYQLKTSQGEPR